MTILCETPLRPKILVEPEDTPETSHLFDSFPFFVLISPPLLPVLSCVLELAGKSYVVARFLLLQ